MTDAQKAARLRMAMDALEQAEAWVKEALGGTDAGQDTLHSISDAIEDLMYDIMELEAVE
jgi:hypothetical protein